MGKTSATGSFQLLIGVAVSTIVMAVGTIIVGNLLTTDQYGLYQIALVPSTLIILFRDWGINSAMTKYIASLRASHREEEINDFITAGLIFEVASGLALSFVSLFLASFVASTLFHRPESALYIAILSASIFSGSLLAAAQAGFVGFERMELNSVTLICQAIVKVAIGPVLILLGYNVFGAVMGAVLGFVTAGIVGLLFFYYILMRPLRKKRTRNSSIRKTMKKMLEYGAPLSIANLLASMLGQIYAFIIVPFTSNTVFGNYQMAIYFTLLLTFITTPIATVLFPAFSKLDRESEPELVKTVFSSSVKYSSMLLVPATMAIMVLSGPMVGTLFRQKYTSAPFFLTLSVISNLFVVVGTLSAGGFLPGLGETKILMKQFVVTLAIGIPLGLILIQGLYLQIPQFLLPAFTISSPALGVTGLIIASLISGLPSMFWVLYWIWKHYSAKADFTSSAKIFAASTIAACTAYLPTILLTTADWIKLVIGLAVFLAIYIIAAPLIGAINQSDINNLRIMSSGMGIITKVVKLPLDIAEKVAKTQNPD